MKFFVLRLIFAALPKEMNLPWLWDKNKFMIFGMTCTEASNV